MKKLILTIIVLTGIRQAANAQETYGNTLNIGLGLGYYGYVYHAAPVLNVNYEIDVAKDFTLAPFASFYTYHWAGMYRQTVVPIGIKGSYYFDDILDASSDWDFYLGASLGVAIMSTHWDPDYTGGRFYNRRDRGTTPIYLDVHAGAEYHFSETCGVFLDLSTGVSTLGLSIRP